MVWNASSVSVTTENARMPITRVRWRERQRLSAADLGAEQLYRLQALGRHLLAPHDWGVVRGLWLVPEHARLSLKWRLTPGIAVDGYGRELLVPEPIDFELPAYALEGGTFRVFLYYCEWPSSTRMCAPCRDTPAPRTRQHVQLVVSDSMRPGTGPAAVLDFARAAGRIANGPAWPVLVGAITLAGPGPLTVETTRYHAQRASILHSPSGRAALRQGFLGPSDPYQLLLSTSSDAGAWERRVGLDRDGVAHVWKQFVISGASASALVPLSASASMLVTADMPAGVGRRIVLEGALENVADPQLTLRWLDNTGARDVVRVDLLKNKRAFLDRGFRFLNMPPVALKLVDAARPARRIQVTHPIGKAGNARELVVQAFSVGLQPSGGLLKLCTRDLVTPEIGVAPCDGHPRTAGAAPAQQATGGAFRFRSATQPIPGPTTRAIQAVSAARADSAPITTLRLSGGEFDEGDHSPRVALGSRDATKGWHSVLTIDGGGRVRMPQPEATLTVSRALQLPPITVNPADPLTQDLLALAYNAGLRRAGRLADVKIAVAFSNPPATVKRGDTLAYSIQVANGAASTITVKRVLELVVGKDTNNGDVTLRSIPLSPGSPSITTGASSTFSAEILKFQHRASHLVIALEILVSVGGKDYALAIVSGQLTVTD